MKESLQLSSLIQQGKKVYLVGIGGVGMSALALVLEASGLCVSGSDIKKKWSVKQLEGCGIPVALGHDTQRVSEADWVIYSTAISQTNPELTIARKLGIPIYHRADVLAFLMNRAISLAVTGTHGKTTSAALASFLLAQAGLHPTCLVGGELLNFGSNVLIGDPHLFIAEVDESDRSQLRFHPDFALITNLDTDHLDVYRDIADLKQSFRSFVDQIKKSGCVIYCLDDRNVSSVVQEALPEAGSISYGLSRQSDFCVHDVVLDGFKSRYVLFEYGNRIGQIELSVPGLHNVVNSLGVIALIRRFGLRYDQFLRFLPDFRGAARRLQVKLQQDRLMVVDDYAHHPTEVLASLHALKQLGKKTTAVFQPHRFSRSAYLADEFSTAFRFADRVLVTDIYGAGEENAHQVRADSIYEAVKRGGHPDVRMIRRDEIVEFLALDRVVHRMWRSLKIIVSLLLTPPWVWRKEARKEDHQLGIAILASFLMSFVD